MYIPVYTDFYESFLLCLKVVCVSKILQRFAEDPSNTSTQTNKILLCLQKKPDWSKGKPGDQKVKEEEVEA